MEALSDFELLFPGINSNIYFFDKKEQIIAKILNSSMPKAEELRRIQNEWQISTSYNWKGKREVFYCLKIEDRESITMQYIPGLSFKDLIQDGPLEIFRFLRLALQATTALRNFHEAGLVHRQISPGHFVFSPNHEEATLIGLGMAIEKEKIDEETELNAHRIRSENLPYIAPEQTGRTEQKVNFRTDLYALGAIFYEALSGSPPFIADNPLQFIHAHIAKAPKPLHETRPTVPKVISKIVLRLLEKEQNKRYPSAEALYKDLSKCLEQWESSSELKEELLSSPSAKFREKISGKLYNRESELSFLKERFERIRAGSVECVMVSGMPGVGKSVLCSQFKKEIYQAKGVFIKGKQDPYQLDIPYHLLVQAIEQFVTYLLTQEEGELEFWKTRISAALGNIGGVLTEIIPNLALILGKQPALPNLQGPELKNRLRRAFRNFFGALAFKHRPLIMLIEDIQWSDINTLDLLESLLTDYRISNFLLLITIRTGVLEEEHPLYKKLDYIKKSIHNVSELEVGNLQESDIETMLVETLNSDIDQRKLLVSKIMSKTNGNPLYTTQYILAIIREKLITYHPEKGKWYWDSPKFDQQLFLGGVSEILVSQVKRLDRGSQNLLSVAACIGNRFNMGLLSKLYPDQALLIAKWLYELESNGLVSSASGSSSDIEGVYQFTHDKVQEAAYNLISEEEKWKTHLTIGKILLTTLDENELEERIFDVVVQLNNTRKSDSSPEFCSKVATLNLQAGQKAKDTAAFNPAYNYIVEGLSWLGPNKWEQHYDLSLALYNKAATLSALIGNYSELDQWYQEVVQNSKTLLEQEEVYQAKIYAFMSEKKMNLAIAYGLKYLEQLKYRFSRKPSKLQVISKILWTHLKLRKLSAEDLVVMKNNTNPNALSAIRILKDTSVAAYFVIPNLNALMVLKTLDISLKHGNSPGSAFAYGGYGFILSGILNSYRRGYDFGKLSIEIGQEKGRKDIKYYQTFIHNIFIRHWVEHTRNTLPDLDEAYRELLDLGNFEFGAYAAHSYIYFSFYLGNDLVELEQKTAAYAKSVSLLNQPTTLQRIKLYWQAIHNLVGNSNDPTLLKGEVYDEEAMIAIHEQDSIIIALHNVYFLKSFLCYLFGQYGKALEYAEKADEYEEGTIASYFVPLKAFLDGLILLAVPNPSQKWKRIKKCLAKMKRYSQSAPDNFLCQYSLLKAEYCQGRNQFSKARVYYEKAIQQARDKENYLVEALAWELGGKFFANQQSQIQASIYLKNAFECYLKWGALAKVRQVENKFGPYLQKATNQLQESVTQNRRAAMDSVDFLSLVKTLQIFSRELDVSRLLDKLMIIAIENAGADSGLLVLEKNGQWEIMAQRDVNNEKTMLLEGQYLFKNEPKQNEQLGPRGLLKYVIRTRKMLVINNVSKDNRFNEEPYILQRGTKSLLCLPLIKQEHLTGLLYLENTLTTGAFTPRIREVLNLISGQVAIFIQNALLYEDLEEKVVQNKSLLSNLKMKVEEQEKTLKLFTQYVPEPVVKKALSSQEVSVWEGELREVAVMFCDIRGFTKMSEELQPKEVVELLNHYYSVMTDIILKYDGIVNQFVGDEIFAIFGAPVPNQRKEINATLCALEMIAALPELNEKYFQKYNKTLVVGIGINGGPVVAGNLGSKTKLAYSITGDTVNTGKRIESLTKVKENAILISEHIYQRCTGIIEVSAWEPVQVRGKKDDIQVYEVLGKKEN